MTELKWYRSTACVMAASHAVKSISGTIFSGGSGSFTPRRALVGHVTRIGSIGAGSYGEM